MPGGLLAGRVAVVTGGGGGIGRGIVERFAAEGAAVVFVEVDGARAADTVAAVEGAGGWARAHVLDATEAGVPHDVVARTRSEHGRLDVLVNNVGHFGGPRAAFHDQPDEEWDDLHRVNLLHVLRWTRSALPVMVEGGGGSVVSISTVEAFRGIPTRAVYSAYKAAITGFTRSLAIEYGHAGVRVNAIAPDVTETLQVPYSRWVTEEQRHLIPTWVPLARFGTPADLAGAALFLASDLGAFVTGTTVHVDGGTLAAGGWYPTEEGGWTNRPRRP